MNKPTLREQIRSRIVAIGMTQAELHRLTGLTEANVSQYVNGKRDLRGSSLDRIVKALGGAVLKWRKRGKAKKQR